VQLSLIAIPQDPIVPPDPVTPAACVQGAPSTMAGFTTARLCGQIKNPGGQTFLSGMLFEGTVGEPTDFVDLLGFGEFITSDCPRLDIEAELRIPTDFVARLRNNPAGFGIVFRTQQYPDGSLSGAFGNEPPGGVEHNDGASGIKRAKGSNCKVKLHN